MTRLLGVLLLTIVALLVATYSWNQGPRVTCTAEGLEVAAAQFAERAAARPRAGDRELNKLARRTRSGPWASSIEALVARWTHEGRAPDPRACRRLRESLKRLS